MVASKDCMLLFIGVLLFSMNFVEIASATNVVCSPRKDLELHNGNEYVRRDNPTHPCRPQQFGQNRIHGEETRNRVIYDSRKIKGDKHIVNPQPYNV